MERIIGRAPEHICALLENGCSGRVEMVNSRGIYLQLDNRHVLLCHHRYGAVPNGIALQQWEAASSLFAPGQPVRSKHMMLHLPSGALEMQLEQIPKDLRILHPTEAALDKMTQLLLSCKKETGLSTLVSPLFTADTVKLNVYAHAALPSVQTLLRALKEENTADIFRSVSALLGLGPGLTPSGDDLLSGLLYGLRHSSARCSLACASLTGSIQALAPKLTNAVSADYLLAITEDAPFDQMAEAWADPFAAGAGLMEIGNNSGCEMLLGLLCAGAILPKIR